MTPETLYQQALLHLQGNPPCYEQGAAYLKKAADLGHMKAQYNFGILLHQDQSYEEAYRYFSLAAEQRDPHAQYMLGCYCAFLDLFSDVHAVHYFRLASEAGLAEAQFNLGVCLLEGKGTAKSEEEAVQNFTLASAQNNADAHYNLGLCYYKGVNNSYQ